MLESKNLVERFCSKCKEMGGGCKEMFFVFCFLMGKLTSVCVLVGLIQ